MHESTTSRRTRVRDSKDTTTRGALSTAIEQLDLNALGWPVVARNASADLLGAHPDARPARVVRVDRGRLLLVATGGSPPTRVRDQTNSDGRVVVGDWVLVEPPALGAGGYGFARARLPRTTVLARRDEMDSVAPQPIAANVDMVFVTEPLAVDRRINEARVARFVALVAGTGIDVRVLLTHADRAEAGDLPDAVAGAPTLATSIVDGRGIDDLRELLGPGVTAAIVGPSGSGKSSLVNELASCPVQAVAERRSSGTGRHTTSTSQLVPLDAGGLVADTPGIRVVGMHADVDVTALVPTGVSELAEGCRFVDCAHDSEPGCAVTDAIDRGVLDANAISEWRKLEREALREQARSDRRLRAELQAGQRARGGAYERARRRGEYQQRR